jgi:hypothetical protein
MLASVSVSSGWGLVAAILVCGTLAAVWLVTLFMIVVDAISIPMKIVWLVVVTVLAPIGIPVYLILRHFRHNPQLA